MERFIVKKKTKCRIVGGAIGSFAGGYFGSGIGIAAGGSAIAGTLPLLLIGLAVGVWCGNRVGNWLEDDDTKN